MLHDSRRGREPAHRRVPGCTPLSGLGKQEAEWGRRSRGAGQGFRRWLWGCTALEGLLGAARPWLPAGTCCWGPETAPKCCSAPTRAPLCILICDAATALGVRSPSPLWPPQSPGCSVLPANEIPSPKLLRYSKPMKTEAASPRVHNSCPRRETSTAHPVPPKARGFLHGSLPWDAFLYPFEVERVSLVNRQADDFRNFKGMDGSKVETGAEEQCHQQPCGRTDPLLPRAQEAEVSAPSGARQPCPTPSADFKALASSFCHVRILL